MHSYTAPHNKSVCILTIFQTENFLGNRLYSLMKKRHDIKKKIQTEVTIVQVVDVNNGLIGSTCKPQRALWYRWLRLGSELRMPPKTVDQLLVNKYCTDQQQIGRTIHLYTSATAERSMHSIHCNQLVSERWQLVNISLLKRVSSIWRQC